MLLFSTILSINPSLTKDDFIKLVIEWNQTSKFKSNIIPGIQWNGERNIRFGDEYFWLDIEEYRNRNIIAVRYEKREADGVIWDTDYVMNFDEWKMSVRLDRSYTADAVMEDQKFSTPHFITLLIEHGYLADDGDLSVGRTPIMINETNAQILANVVNGEADYRLPIVYISKTPENTDPVNTGILAGRLKGVAHVLVQESRDSSHILKEFCNGANEYSGAVGIYYPKQTIEHRKYLNRSAIGYDEFLMEKTIRQVIHYNNAQMVDTLYTWQGVNNALLLDKLKSQREERLRAEEARAKAEREVSDIRETLDEEKERIRREEKEQARHEADTLIEGFDDDMQRLQRQVEELTRANEALQYENQGLKAKLDANGDVPVLNLGDEYEFFQGEIKDLILMVLTDALKDMSQKSRRSDVVKDIIRSNDYRRICAGKAEEIKVLLKNYDGMSSRLRQELINLGFKITDDGKHYKLTYYEDGRYTLAMSKTPSDVRTGKNAAQEIIRAIF